MTDTKSRRERDAAPRRPERPVAPRDSKPAKYYEVTKRREGRWRTRITVDGARQTVGTFDSKEAAEAARVAAHRAARIQKPAPEPEPEPEQPVPALCYPCGTLFAYLSDYRDHLDGMSGNIASRCGGRLVSGPAGTGGPTP